MEAASAGRAGTQSPAKPQAGPPSPVSRRSPGLPEDVRRQIEADWEQQELVTRRLRADSPEALDGVLRRGRLMVADTERAGALEAAREAARSLDAVQAQRDALAAANTPSGEAWRQAYLQARWAVREMAFRHPRLDFDRLLFVRRHWPEWGHQCSHHTGEGQRPGADLCVLTGLRPDGQVGSVLGDRLPPGGIGRPDLSFDGRRIVFPYAAPRVPPTSYGFGRHGARGGACHMYDLYEVGVDGKGLRRLTNTPAWEDTEPCYLPSGRIAFTSTRDGRFVQCGDWALVFGLYSMAPGGSDVRRITEAKEGEWYPSVLEDGRLLYMRWEYVMKAYNTIQYLWTANPDGTRAQLAYGDHFAFSRGPLTFIEARQIPGTSQVIATGAAHHNAGVGPICIVDLARNRSGAEGFRNVTPEVGYPEADMSNVESPAGWYSSPWPLSDTLFLGCYSFQSPHNARDGYGLYLMDVHGNKELVYRDAGMSCYSPIPLRPRRRPPVIPDAVKGRDPQAPGTMLVMDIYQGLPGVPRGTVKYLRVLETLPKKKHSWPQRLDLGVASGWDPRAVLGTVPVEPDGSACFRVPPDRALFFEALDEDYLEVRRMRSFVTARPGESVSCVGCHEGYSQAPVGRRVMATARHPRDITPPPWGAGGMDFRKVVQPVLDRHCVRCHDGTGGPDRSFDLRAGELVVAPVWQDQDEGPQHKVSQPFLGLLGHVSYIRVSGYEGGNLPLAPYATGSHQSKLMQLLKAGHKGVRLPRDDWQALAAWIDCNAPFYGGWDDIEAVPEAPATRPVARTPEQQRATAARKEELGKRAPAGFHLACYLDCGPEEEDGRPGGPVLKQTAGLPWLYYPGEDPAPARFSAISFDGEAVVFEAARLNPKRAYRLGLTWWDWDGGGRVQSVRAYSPDGKQTATLLATMPLPQWNTRREMPQEYDLELPRALYASGRATLAIQREAAVNAVVCEVWLWESDQ